MSREEIWPVASRELAVVSSQLSVTGNRTGTQKGPRSVSRSVEGLVHAANSTAARRSRSRLVFLLLDDDGFRRQQETRDRRRVLQRRARDLRRVDDARGHEVLVGVGERVIAEVLVLR